MRNYSPELLKYRRYSNLHGEAIDVTAGRRNGKPAVFLLTDSIQQDSLNCPAAPAAKERPTDARLESQRQRSGFPTNL